MLNQNGFSGKIATIAVLALTLGIAACDFDGDTSLRGTPGYKTNVAKTQNLFLSVCHKHRRNLTNSESELRRSGLRQKQTQSGRTFYAVPEGNIVAATGVFTNEQGVKTIRCQVGMDGLNRWDGSNFLSNLRTLTDREALKAANARTLLIKGLSSEEYWGAVRAYNYFTDTEVIEEAPFGPSFQVITAVQRLN